MDMIAIIRQIAETGTTTANQDQIRAAILAHLKSKPTAFLQQLATLLKPKAKKHAWFAWCLGEIETILFDRSLIEMAEEVGLPEEMIQPLREIAS